MRVGEVAERAGVNVETLRYYERRGLLPAPDRDPSGHRRYDDDTVRFLRAIKEAQAVGFTLAEIAEYLGAAKRTSSPSEELRVRMAAKIDEIDGRIAALQRMRGQLAQVIGCACDSLDHCTCGAAWLARRGREAAAPPTLLHVTNGESAGNTLRQTSLGGAVLTWQDALHAGPVPAGPRGELLRTRAAFLAESGWGSRRALLSSLERRDRQYLDALRTAHVVLWFEHDLYDQLQLVDALALAGDAELELIVVDRFLGPLGPNELELLWPERRAPGDAERADAAAAWAALRAPEPSALAGLEVPSLRFLRPALDRLLDELPSAQDGLSLTERYALETLADGPLPPRAMFVAAQARENARFLGDTWFFAALAELGRGDRRLVETVDGAPLPAPPPRGDAHVYVQSRLRLTPLGEQVLAGLVDRVELLGIDRWVGGTHVTPDRLWRRDGSGVSPA